MGDLLLVGLVAFLGAALIAAIILQVIILARRKRQPTTTISSSIEHMRSIGQLSVFRVIMKEIVTEMDHSWGEFGKKYLSWVLSSKKMAMIFEFEIDFQYDLRRSDFQITETGEKSYLLQLPECLHRVNIRDIRFYDEQHARFLPWLLPDLLNAFSNVGFREEEKNRLVEAAKSHAEEQAREMIGNLKNEVENSARQTLELICKALGARTVTFRFSEEEPKRLQVDYQEPQKQVA